MVGFLAVGGGAAVDAWIRWWVGTMLNPIFPTMPLGTLQPTCSAACSWAPPGASFSHYESKPPEARLLALVIATGG